MRVLCDVLTCACPNHRSVGRGHATDAENDEALKKRIRFVLNVLATEGKDYIILGAYGCGVFEQNPASVASIFKELVNNEFNGTFKLAVFAIPDENSDNFKAFRQVLCTETAQNTENGAANRD